MNTLKLTDDEITDIIYSLGMWRNYIETRNPILSAADAINQKNLKIIKPLEPAQKKKIVRLEELMEKMRSV